MAKFTAEEKLQAVLRYMNGNESFKTIAQSIGADEKIFGFGRNNTNIMVQKHL